MKVAIFYDWLNQFGGAERVLLNILQIYPEADLYTLVYDYTKTSWLPKNIKVSPSFINKLPFSRKHPFIYSPIFDLCLEKFDFSQYNLVISTTSTIGHCLLTPPTTLFVCYFHNINRYLYQFKTPFLRLYKPIDKVYSHRPDLILCNSKTVSHRIQKNYQLTPTVINPGIDTKFFRPSKYYQQNTKYYLVVSRLVPHKKIDIAIQACLQLKKTLYIVGSGRDQNRLNDIAQNSHLINFLGETTNYRLKKLYQNCTALICPQLEDFGLSALEAQACGRPVIAYGKGGHTETVTSKTGVFFKQQSVDSLIDAIKKFETKRYSSNNCRHRAQKFSHTAFMLNFKKIIDTQWELYQNT